MDVDPTRAASTEDLAGRIRESRVARDWTQIELAEHAGVSRPTVARVERGDDVSTATLAKLAGALGLRVELTEGR